MSDLLSRLGILDDSRVQRKDDVGVDTVRIENPASEETLAYVSLQGQHAYNESVERAMRVQRSWRVLPAPKRGEIVRQIGNAIRAKQDDLGELVTREMGKIRTEGVGEVIECIDMADFSVGLSRQLYGLSMHSERPEHRMLEQWHPLGTIGIITAFNFPVAVWAWNAMVAAVCGNAMLWKPSLRTPLTAVAMTRLARDVMDAQDVFQPEEGKARDLFQLIIGRDDVVGEPMIADRRLPLISATGSCKMGRHVGGVVAGRLGKSLLELGGNNAVIVMPDADVELATRAVLFGAVGTAGQRCTSTRRLYCHRDIKADLMAKLVDAYGRVSIGDPVDPGTLMGPLIHEGAIQDMKRALEAATSAGGRVLCGGLPGIARFRKQNGHFVEPTIIDMPAEPIPDVVREETFAPVLYSMEVDSLEQAIRLNNAVDQGLSSALFTGGMRAAERFLSPAGSDCGIANINIGTSGAEIGGAFGGEKDTGGGREAGSDAWKAYMRRQTCTINYGTDLPLAQGVSFGD